MTKTHSRIHRLRRALLVCLCAWLVAAPVKAAVDLAEVPLYLTAGVQPNLMFILDDSGSMQFEVMPESLRSFSTIYLFPPRSNMYGGSTYISRIVVFLDDDSGNVRARSSNLNRVFYDPLIDYEPWFKADASQYAEFPPDAAPYNPEILSVGTLDLTAQQTHNSWRLETGSDTQSRSFWPITFYVYKGAGATDDPANYTKYQIRGGNGYSRDLAGGAEQQVTTFSWPGGISRTVAQEAQNFANWFTYHRSRVLAARAGIGKVFAFQGENLRVGFGTLNTDTHPVDGKNTASIVTGVRAFSGTGRQGFFDKLYGTTIPAAGTPARLALKRAGEYFARTDNAGPWGNTPGDNADDSPHVSCRQNYTILMTDGYWNGATPSVGNVDNTEGATITGPDNDDYQYSPVNPFKDNVAETLADVAMHYWKRDLRANLTNNVPTSDDDPAFWQHMVTFGVGLGVAGSIDPDTAWTAVTNGTAIAWPDPTPSTANEAKLDDMLHAAINSRGGYFSASDPDAFFDGLSDTLAAILARTKSSASAATANSSRLIEGGLVYLAGLDSSDWSGRLFAYPVLEGGEISDSAAWNAGAFDILPAASSRNIFTLNGTAGVAFEWANLSDTQQAALNSDGFGTTDGYGEQRVAWLRGDDSNEAPAGLDFRSRAQSKLGDIVNSDPLFVGNQNYGFNALPGTEGASYVTFRADTAERTTMLYVGANDGMLHGFGAEDGVERLAYVPEALYPYLSKLTSEDYTHRYYVDGSPQVSDAYIGEDGGGTAAWRTVLVGTTGAGGRSVFALDVTNPDSFDASDVLWEFNAADNAELGYTLGEAAIARVRAGNKWVALVANGYNSASHKAQLFILDLKSGEALKVLDTGVGDEDNPNGLHAPTPVDVNGDRIVDFVYAGDLLGNLWKFDLTGNASSDWAVAQPGGSEGPLFTAEIPGGGGTQVQPIAQRPTVSLHPQGGVMVYFGTGKFFEVGDEVIGDSPDIQTFYAIWDKGTTAVSRDQLVEQTIDWEGEYDFTLPDDSVETELVRSTSQNDVDYATKMGWFLNLLSPVSNGNQTSYVRKGERAVAPAILIDGVLALVSGVPNPDVCSSGGASSVIVLDPRSGERFTHSVFDLNGDKQFDENDMVMVDGEMRSVNGRGWKGGLTGGLGTGTTDNGTVLFGGGSNTGGGGTGGGTGGPGPVNGNENIHEMLMSRMSAPGRKGWWQIR